MPSLRAFRALRYDPKSVPDLGRALCPPYDIISPQEQQELLARDPHNAVRLELPSQLDGEDPDGRYRSAARTLAAWRSDGTLRKDRAAAIYVHEMRTPSPGGGGSTVARGFLARLRLEPFEAGSGVRPHERTMSGPKEDRFKLLRATGTNFSPVILLHEGGADRTTELLDRLTARRPDLEAHTDDGAQHRLWIVPEEDETGTADEAVAELLALASARPLTIADGHHRYETALRYRDERGQNRACESDPAWDYVLALLYETRQAPTVLPTHRVVRDGPRGEELMAGVASLFDVERLATADELLPRMAGDAPDPRTASGERGSGRFGLVTDGVAAILRAKPDAFVGLVDPGASEASRWLDVNLLARAFERLLGVDAAALASGGRLTYTKDAREAVHLVESSEAASAWLVDPTPVASVARVAEAGEVMPQKSTYFYPKAPTGLVFGPLEW